MRHTRLSNMLALALLAPTASYAQVLYSNYGPGDSYSQGFIGGTTFAGYGKSAARFVPPIGGEFDRVETSLGRIGGGPTTVSGSLSIVPEVQSTGGPLGGIPGLLPVWSATNVSGPLQGRAIVTFTGPRAMLNAGQAYWVVIEATDGTSWYLTEPSVSGATASRNGSALWSPSAPTLPAFRVSGSGAAPGMGACCNTINGGCAMAEPAACATLGLSFAGVGVACAAAPCVACPGDFNRTGGVTLQDLFDYLSAWFAGCP